MRTRHITSDRKLSILILVALLLSNSIAAKEKPKDTNIVCFAAKNKWVCAPEDQQDIANKKAQKLIDNKKSNSIPNNVVIKPISIPKFQTIEEPIEPEKSNSANINTQHTKKPESFSTKEIVASENPYAKLWAHQLIGVSTPNSAINFVKNKHLRKEDVLIIKSVRNNMDWWIILFGLYKDKQTGIENEINLPDNINNPWLRPLKNLLVKGFIDDF